MGTCFCELFSLGSKALYVARAQKKEERKQYLQRLHEEKRNEIINKSNVSFTNVFLSPICSISKLMLTHVICILLQESNVYIKNIHDEVDDDTLRARFDEFGNITSAKVMRDDKGISRGFGFVCFSTPEEAKSAVSSMRGNFIIVHKHISLIIVTRLLTCYLG